LATWPPNNPALNTNLLYRPWGIYLIGDTAELIQTIHGSNGRTARLFIRFQPEKGCNKHDVQTLVVMALSGVFILSIVGVVQFFPAAAPWCCGRSSGWPPPPKKAAAQGDYQQRIPVDGQDELAMLGKKTSTCCSPASDHARWNCAGFPNCNRPSCTMLPTPSSRWIKKVLITSFQSGGGTVAGLQGGLKSWGLRAPDGFP